MPTPYFDRKMAALWMAFILVDVGMLTFGPHGMLDARFYYSSQDAVAYMNGLSPSQADLYFHNELVDFGLIATYSFLLFLSLKRLFPARSKWPALIPCAFDLVETSVILGCTRHPEAMVRFPWLGTVTCLKWLSGALLAGYCGVAVFQRQRQSQRRRESAS